MASTLETDTASYRPVTQIEWEKRGIAPEQFMPFSAVYRVRAGVDAGAINMFVNPTGKKLYITDVWATREDGVWYPELVDSSTASGSTKYELFGTDYKTTAPFHNPFPSPLVFDKGITLADSGQNNEKDHVLVFKGYLV